MFDMPAFEGLNGTVWYWDSASKSYKEMQGGGLPDPDRGHASGGDNNLFDPATQYQGNPYGDGDGNSNPLQEGILARTAEFNGYDSWETNEIDDWINNDENTQAEFYELARTSDNPEDYLELFNALHPEVFEMWAEMTPEPGYTDEVDWAAIMQSVKADLAELEDYMDKSPSDLTAPTSTPPIYDPNVQGPDEPEDMIRGARTASLVFRPGDRVWYTPQGGSVMHPGEKIGATIGEVSPDGYVRVDLDSGQNLFLEEPAAEQALAYMNPEEAFNPEQKYVNSPYDSESPQQLETMVMNAHKKIPGHYDYREGTDEKHCGNCEYFNRGHCSMFKTLVQSDKVCNEWETGPQQKESSLDGHAEDCGCPECDKLRNEWEQVVPQEHDTGPFPDRAPKPNRWKTDNSFPSMVSSDSNAREAMDIYSHIPTWDEQVRHEAADLDSCPTCGDGMIDHKGDKACHSCGTRQPIIYASLKQAGPEMAIPMVEEALAGEGGAGGAGIGSTMNNIAGSADDVAGANPQKKNQQQERPLQEQNPNTMSGPTSQGMQASVSDHLRWALRDFQAGAFGEEETGGAVKNQGQDDNPAEKGTQGFNEEHGGAPELLKNVNDIGGGKSPAVEIYEAALPHMTDLKNQGHDMVNHPLFQLVDQMLEAEFPGYRDGAQPISVEVIDPNAPSPDEQTGEAADGKDDEQDKNQPDNMPKAAAMPMQPGVTNPQGMGMPMGEGLQSDAPCPICGMDDCPHKRGQQGNAVPNPTMQMANPLQAGQGPYMSSTHEARRPKMCPFHSELVDWSLQFGDPEKAMGMLNTHMFSEQSCKGGHGGTCNFKPGMVKQEYWDAHDRQLQEQRDIRTQLDSFEPVTVQPEGVPADHEYTSPEPSVRAEAPSTAPMGGDGHRPTSEGQGSAVGAPTMAKSKWHVSLRTFEEELEGVHGPEHLHVAPDEAAAGGTNWHDETGRPLIENDDYEMKAPNYEIPDHVTVKQLTDDTLHIVIHGEMGMDYGDTITQQDMANEGYTFMPVIEVNPHQEGAHDPDHTDSAPMDQDSAAQVDDLSMTTASVMSPEAREHYERIASMEGEADLEKHPEREWLFQSAEVPGGVYDGIDPDTLQKIAGKDFTAREQREFIDEEGTARNLDLLDLEDTHYPPQTSVDAGFLW